VKRRRHLEVAPPELVVGRVACHERLEQLERSRRVPERVLSQDREPAVNLGEPRRPRELELECERAGFVLETAQAVIGRGKERCDARSRRLVVDERFSRLKGGRAYRLTGEQSFDVRHGLAGVSELGSIKTDQAKSDLGVRFF
jgi:hypothetical protein